MKYIPQKSHCFTLTELMVVVVIVAIMMALVVPAFNSMGAGTAVDSAARMVSTQLMLARNEAIARRAKVAVVIYEGDKDTDFATKCAFRSAIVTGNTSPYTFQEWVPNTEWTYLPDKTAIVAVNSALPGIITESGEDYKRTSSTTVPKDDDNAPEKITDASGTSIRAVVFKPNGTCEQSAYLTILQTLINENGDFYSTNLENFHVLEVNKYTGKARFLRIVSE